MAGPASIVGNKLSITIDGVEYNDNFTSAVIKNADADASQTTYFEASQGGSKDYTIDATVLQSFAPGAFYRTAIDNPGKKVAFRYAPYANAVASNTQPHLVGFVTLAVPDTIGTAAATDGTRGTVDVSLKIEGTPTLDYGTSGLPSVVAVTPATAAAGDIVKISGVQFTGADASGNSVKFGTTNATAYRVDNDNTILAVVPAGITGATTVTVKATAGTSTAFAYTAA